jgi:hypothetical protein
MRTLTQPEVHLNGHVQLYDHHRRALLAEFPDLDDTTLSDTLEGITDLKQMLAELVRSALDDEALAEALSTRLSDMKGRLDRIEDRAKRKRQLVLRAMTDSAIAKLTEPDFTASLKNGVPTLEIVAEENIPAAYWKPQPPKLDKQSILTALKSGAEVEGTCLVPAVKQLSVRTK